MGGILRQGGLRQQPAQSMTQDAIVEWLHPERTPMSGKEH
jgi:hypothetical protein